MERKTSPDVQRCPSEGNCQGVLKEAKHAPLGVCSGLVHKPEAVHVAVSHSAVRVHDHMALHSR